MVLSIIAAFSLETRAIGKNGKMIWSLPEDLKRFKNLTMHHYCITGRKTYESLPPLPGRKLIVLTSKEREPEGDTVFVNNLQTAFKICKNEEQVFCIGGAEVYKLCLPFSSHLYITEVKTSFSGDAFFPLIPAGSFDLTSEEHKTECTFKVYSRKNIILL